MGISLADQGTKLCVRGSRLKIASDTFKSILRGPDVPEFLHSLNDHFIMRYAKY